MRSFSQILLLATAALVPFVSAAPVEEKGHFSVKQVRNTSYQKNGAFALARAYRKYGKTLPEGLVSWIQELEANITIVNNRRRTTGSVTTTPEAFDTEYLTPVSIGTPAQTLNLDFDTGSSDLWVFSSLLASSAQSGHSIYNPSSSSTSANLSGYSWKITYGDGSSASGSVYTDVVSIAGISFSKQAIEATSTISTEFTQDTNSDGLVGLAFSSINQVSPTQQKTFFDNVKSTLDSPLFAADLRYEEAGTYDFGFADTTKYSGDISYVDADSSDGYWGFTSSGYRVGSTSYSTSTAGIADTGTTLLMLPDAIVNNYYASITGASNSASYGGWVFPCSATLSTFSYVVGSLTIDIPAAYLNYSPVSDGSSICYGGLQSSANLGINIYGDVALKAAYVIFDGSSTPQLGFAAKASS